MQYMPSSRGGHCPPLLLACFRHVFNMFFYVLLVFGLNTCLGHWRTIQYKRHVLHMYLVYKCMVHAEHKKYILRTSLFFILWLFLITKLFLLTASLNNVH